MNNLFFFIEKILGSFPIVFCVTLSSCLFKCFILIILIKRGTLTAAAKRSRFLLMVLLASAIIVDSAWILHLFQVLFFPTLDFRIRIFWIRIAWCFSAIQYQSLALFIESFTQRTYYLNSRQKIFMCISTFFSLFFVGLTFYNYQCFQPNDRPFIESIIHQIFPLYTLFFLMTSTLIAVYMKLKYHKLPRILHRQLIMLIQFLIIPQLLSDFIQASPFGVMPTFISNSYAAVTVSTILLTYAFYYCMRKIMGLRFLNIQNHVQQPHRVNFIDSFKDVLEKLSHATTLPELEEITKTFFQETFQVPAPKIQLHICQEHIQWYDFNNTYTESLTKPEETIEYFLRKDDEILWHIKELKILIYDEIDFSNFYDDNQITRTMVQFLEEIHVDILLPLYHEKNLIGYITIEQKSRGDTLYSNADRDEMLVFSTYLINIIHLLQTRNLSTLIQKERQLSLELYSKHQEINQYKESMRLFLKAQQKRDIGIMFYKNKKFSFGNQAAKELLPINVNTHYGHPLSKACKDIAMHVTEYKTPKSITIKNQNGNQLVISGIPNTERNNVIITLSPPNLADIIGEQTSFLKDPTMWDYLLYLETTQSGKLINKAIPGSGETILNFKLHLLKISLSKKPILLEMPEDDLVTTVELIHHISLRNQLHILKLTKPTTNQEIAIKLFGINPLFGQSLDPRSIFEKLENTGTLFIENIEFLDLESQEYLAEYISYGFYRVFKSDKKYGSDIRIICSTQANLEDMVQKRTFCADLYKSLQNTTISLPSLSTLPEEELQELTDKFAEQALEVHDFKNMLELSDRDKNRIMIQRPISLSELKYRVHQLITKKSKDHDITVDTPFHIAYHTTDPDLIHAARLGKQALRDQKIMALLWKKFQSQNKIATFLGVNRSSVNRRCKEFNLQ